METIERKTGINSPRDALILGGTVLAAVALNRRAIIPALQETRQRWREEPAKQVGRIASSTLLGQGVFWTKGYDQLGILQDTKVQFGKGQQIAEKIYPRIPESPAAAWAIKAAEIATDFARGPIEGSLHRQFGVAPDGVAALVSQPLWSTIEAGEKLAGAIAHPQSVSSPESVKVSLACIYGSLVRTAVSSGVYLVGKAINSRQSRETSHFKRI